MTLAIMGFQAALLLGATFLAFALFLRASPDGVVIHPQLLSAISASITRDADGGLSLDPTPQLGEFMATSPELWIIIRGGDGEDLTYGPVPEIASYIMDVSGELKAIESRGSDGNTYLTSRFERSDSPAGAVSIFAGGGALLSDGYAVLALAVLTAAIPITTLLLLTGIGLPFVVHASFRSLRKVSEQIDGIDYQVRGMRIHVAKLPKEIYPMVRGLNEALRRIDEGAERTERFFVHAAHELRTPIAILQVRLDALDAGAETEKFKLVVRRLAALANQLLNIETFRQKPMARSRLDLVRVVAEAVGDLAPYAVAEGYTIAMDAPDSPVWIDGDATALDRMFVNLIQNAIQHGGKTGAITVRVSPSASVEVADEGPGISVEKQCEVFEPFYRIHGHGDGSGLGLTMVQDIAQAHGAKVALESQVGVGTTFRVDLMLDDGT